MMMRMMRMTMTITMTLTMTLTVTVMVMVMVVIVIIIIINISIITIIPIDSYSSLTDMLHFCGGSTTKQVGLLANIRILVAYILIISRAFTWLRPICMNMFQLQVYHVPFLSTHHFVGYIGIMVCFYIFIASPLFTINSLDWFEGKFSETPHFWWENHGFPFQFSRKYS